MKKALAIVWRNDVPEYRTLLYPEYKDDGFYRQILSLDAFKNREARKLYNWRHIKKRSIKELIWCSIRYEHDLEFDKKWILSPNVKFNDLPLSKDVWQFYRDIGYDYKKQRYL
jgi:hypothetical protein